MATQNIKDQKPPRLYPGETNPLVSMNQILNNMAILMESEVKRLKVLGRNPTFPKAQFDSELTKIEASARYLQDIALEGRQ